MKIPRLLLLAGLAFACAWPALLSAADAAKTAAGYWEGSIMTPRGDIPIMVELVMDKAAWQGTLDSPRQGLRGFKLDPLKVADSTVEFGLPGIPGDPSFSGKLAPDGASIAGDFTQAGNTASFHLDRKTKPASTVDEHAVPAKGEPGKGLAGKWRGSIKPMPGMELRLDAELQADAAGKVTGDLISIDQGGGRISIETVTEKEGAVQFDVPQIRGGFVGKLNADGSELAGEWSQAGRTTPLVFKRLVPKS